MESIATPRLVQLAAACLALAAIPLISAAATADQATPLHLRPDSDAPVVATLPAGAAFAPLTTAELVAEGVTDLSPGWVGIRHPGPYFGYAANVAVAKDLTVNPGAEIRARPEEDAPVLHVVGEEEIVEVVEPAAGWVKVVFSTEQIVFLRASANATAPADEGTAPAPDAEPASLEADRAGDVSGSGVTRGYLLKARPLWRSGQRYDYQLVDEDNQRIALLDTSQLLPAEPIENLANRLVEVFGTPVDSPEIKEGVVIRVQTIQLASAATE